jgi:hypothetical protein
MTGTMRDRVIRGGDAGNARSVATDIAATRLNGARNAVPGV